MTTTSQRYQGLDIARGILLAAMLAVHVISAHGAADQVNALHHWFGVFLISSGFVGVSGYVIGLRSRRLGGREIGRGFDRGLHLLIVMFAYGVLLSLLRHGLALVGGGASGCSAETGWTPPLRFDDIGILLPIAIVQILGPLAGARGRWVPLALIALAGGWAVLPALTGGVDSNLIVDILMRRSLTPFYTVASFVAIGVIGVVLGRARLPVLTSPLGTPLLRVGAPIMAVFLAMPPVSRLAIDPVYLAAGDLGGALATLIYWSVVLVLFLVPFAPAAFAPAGSLGRSFALLGRNSLFVFILHDLLLVVDAAVRDALGMGKSGTVVLLFLVVNLGLMVGGAHLVERSGRVRAWINGFLLGRSHPGSLLGGGPFTIPGALALASLLAVYTSSALVRPDRVMMIDDFESSRCPVWWTFGFVPQERVAGNAGAHGANALLIHGAAPGTYAHGRGLFLDRDIGDRKQLLLRVRGDGPGSGRIKIELSEDDNGNWEIEKQPPLYVPIFDDRFVHELSVDWRGWRDVAIPLEAFRDDNPNGGNNLFDPARDLTSGGLLDLQFLFTPAGAYGDEVRLGLDNIRFAP